MNTDYHKLFLTYLKQTNYKVNGDTACEELVNFAEKTLPKLLISNGLSTFSNIYDNLDLNIWNKISTDMLEPVYGDMEHQEHIANILKALKYFKGFIKFNQSSNFKKDFEKNLIKEKKQKKLVLKFLDDTIPEEENTFRTEGSLSQVCVTHYERDPENRRKALEKYGYTCQVCGMDFEKTYGDIGKDFIEVHHMYPVCNMGENYEFDPLDPQKGLIPLCPNCHSMIHRGGRVEIRDGKKLTIPMTLDELRDLYQKNKK